MGAGAEDVFGLTGETVAGKYRVDALVGEGGFGVVYRGFHLDLEVAVALKCLKVPAHFTADARRLFLGQFRTEGKLLAKLGTAHLSIVRVYDIGEIERPGGAAVPYLVLEWLDGRELRAVIDERWQSGLGPWAEADALALLRPAIEALAAAHERGIAHRDIKPQNLFLANERQGTRLKVLDFGIAKAMQEGERATQLATRTATGFKPFSPWYGAPEQFLSEKYGATGPWTDVHAMGLIVAELVSGRPPLEGENAFALMVPATSAERPTPRRLGAQVSDGLEAVCQKALALHPRERFRTGTTRYRSTMPTSRRERETWFSSPRWTEAEWKSRSAPAPTSRAR
ncbi:MAG: serine/threonine protein kinase [Deltaproteobacteria bacterium]|nr:serine/threonine protein kinase [Deltaproteobacteria bacterium]